jgi:AcrR family transcriptional regulator
MSSDPSPPRRRLEPDERRRQILAHAVRLFGELPYAEVSTTDLATSAGVARGLIHHYFGTKRELYLEVVRVMVTVPPVVLDRLPPGPPAQRVDASVTWFLDAVSRHGRSWLAAIGAGNDPEVERIRAEAERATAELMLQAFGLDGVGRHRDQLTAMLRCWTGLARSAAAQWLGPGTLSRDEVQLLLTQSLQTLVYRTFPAVSPEVSVLLAAAADDPR